MAYDATVCNALPLSPSSERRSRAGSLLQRACIKSEAGRQRRQPALGDKVILLRVVAQHGARGIGGHVDKRLRRTRVDGRPALLAWLQISRRIDTEHRFVLPGKLHALGDDLLPACPSSGFCTGLWCGHRSSPSPRNRPATSRPALPSEFALHSLIRKKRTVSPRHGVSFCFTAFIPRHRATIRAPCRAITRRIAPLLLEAQ